MLYEYKQLDWGEASLKKICLHIIIIPRIYWSKITFEAQMVFMLEVKIIGFS